MANTHARWMRHAERATLAQAPGDARAAVRVFKGELSFAERLTLAEEIVATRGAELCRAYADVVAVTWGVRRRRGRVRREPCVTFVVKRKRSLARVPRAARVPSHLFAHWTVGTVRKLCAVPTDVEDAAERAAIRARSAFVVAHTAGAGPVRGVLTWAVKRGNAPGHVYALSCRHVLSPVLRPRFVSATVTLRDSSVPLGETSAIAGRLEDDVRWSLDAQLAEVGETAALESALDGIRITQGHATNRDQIADRPSFWVRAPTRAIRARFKEFIGPGGHPLDYRVAGARRVLHEQLVLIVLPGPTVNGESGAPVLSERDGGMLLGMHVGSNDDGLGLMIPAWQLIGPRGYEETTPTETWELWNAGHA